MGKILFTKKCFLRTLLTVALIVSFCTGVNAAPLSVFSGWTQFANDDGVGINGYVGPGYGAQKFDAEYLFYKYVGNVLSIGIQAGFNLNAPVVDGCMTYYNGDLGLSFDTTPNKYEYAVDFGLLTKDYGSHLVGTTGTHTAGVYKNITWNTHVYSGYTASNPFAMESGTLIGGLITNSYSGGLNGNNSDYSYYRIVSFPDSYISEIIPGQTFLTGAHWTMSCGNDEVRGTFNERANVPEPGTMVLLGSSLFGIALSRRKKVLVKK